MSQIVTPNDFSEIRWRGHWVWVPEEPIKPIGFLGATINPKAPEAHGLFRRQISLENVPERVPARITADSRYLLFVNGQEVSRGPIRSQPRRLHYDLLDLAGYLRPGENVIAVYVKYYGTSRSFWMPVTPNLTLGRSGVMVFEANLGAAGWLVSDASWKAHKSEAWDNLAKGDDLASSGIPIELFDARRFPNDWLNPDFDDSAWGQAQPVPAMHIGGFARTQPPSDPYGPLFPRPIAALTGDVRHPAHIQVNTLSGAIDPSDPSPVRRVAASLALPMTGTTQSAVLPLQVEADDTHVSRLEIDMGRVVSGLVTFEIEAAAGLTLELSYLEDALSDSPRLIQSHSGSRYTARGSNDRFQTFESYGLRYAYMLANGPFTLRSFAVHERLYPWQAGASFSCSDAELNRIYTAGVRTVQLNSHDAFIDCPTREQRAWVGDGVVHQMVHLATNCDWRLAWRYLELGNSPRSDGILPMSVVGDIEADGGFTIPDWALNWIHGVYNAYCFNGDRSQIKALLPTVERVLRWYLPYQSSSGVLKDVVEWNLIDWSSVSVADTSALLTALWARGLREYAEMAGWLEEHSSQQWASQIYESIKAGFEVFWNEQRGSYVDHVVDGVQQPEMSQLAGALAIVSGLAPAARWQRIIERITDPTRLVIRSWTGGDQGEYAMEKLQKQLQGIYEPDWDVEQQVVIAQPFMSYTVHDAVAQAGMADRLPALYRRWSSFLVDGYDTIGEGWGWGTHVHGWSCTPTRDMLFYTLGITPAAPGYTAARIAPRLGSLSWAKGRVPTPHGLISVEVDQHGIQIDTPIPVRVELEGREAQELAPGRHSLTRT